MAVQSQELFLQSGGVDGLIDGEACLLILFSTDGNDEVDHGAFWGLRSARLTARFGVADLIYLFMHWSNLHFLLMTLLLFSLCLTLCPFQDSPTVRDSARSARSGKFGNAVESPSVSDAPSKIAFWRRHVFADEARRIFESL